MCELCRRNPCVSTCPNAPEPEPVYICSMCEEGIYDGDDYYEIDDKYYCADCIRTRRFTAEYNPPVYDEDYAYERWRDEHE